MCYTPRYFISHFFVFLFFAFTEDDDKWLSKLHASKWLKYVSKTLHGAASLAKLLDFKNISLVGKE